MSMKMSNIDRLSLGIVPPIRFVVYTKHSLITMKLFLLLLHKRNILWLKKHWHQ